MNPLSASFQSPPEGFGEVAFYWWVGGKLDRERIRWQLDQLAGAKISGLQINYAHGPTGGISWGLTYPSDPPLFSEEWWELFAWFKGEANARGMAVSLSDYTLGIGQGWFCDEIIRDPGLRGSVLEAVVLEADSDMSATWTPDTLAAYAVKGGGESFGTLPRRLRPFSGGVASLPDETVVVVRAVTRPHSLDPMNPEVGRRYIAGFFQQFEDRFPGECGSGLNYFFSDELDLGVAGNLWTARFADEFLRRKGYDLMDELPALFIDIGPRTPKVRLDYRDVMVALEEESFFLPIYEWHEARGMTYGCDHGWRGRKPTEFGDYFRTQRWNQGPGCDQPRLEADVVKNKVASSIAHLNQRPRTWLEGFYSSGWGTTSAQIADAVFRNFAMGHNLLTLHGLYYSTHGGWWEWAPPCNHFRMPYWPHFRRFLECSERLSFLLSRGVHVCNIGILYPVAATEGGPGGAASSKAAFELAEALYSCGIDFDFIDFETLEKAKAVDGGLVVSGEAYRVLVIPPMPVIRFSSIEAAERMAAAGGRVIFLDRLPYASDRAGREDPVLRDRCETLLASDRVRRMSVKEAAAALAESDRDFRVLEGDGHPFVQHRIIEGRHLFFIYGMEAGTLVELRATGRVTRWNPWDGTESVLPVESVAVDRTRLRLPEGPATPYLIWFGPVSAEVSEVPCVRSETRTIDGPWTCEAVPCLDNQWGDFRLPAHQGFIGPEIRLVDVETAAGNWQSHACGTGPLYECFESEDSTALRKQLLSGVPMKGRPLLASWRWGLPDDPGFQGWHGLKGRVHDDLFSFEGTGVTRFLRTTVHVEEDTTAYWNLGGCAQPVSAWMNRQAMDTAAPLALSRGKHEVVLEFHSGGRGYAVLATEEISPVSAEPAWFGPLQTRWFNNPRVLPMGLPGQASEAMRVRFQIPPGTRAFTCGLLGELLEIRVDGRLVTTEHIVRDATRFPSVGTTLWRVCPPVTAKSAMVELHVRPRAGLSGGHVVPDPVLLDLGPFEASLGDWAEWPGFECFSGGMRYTADFEAPGTSGRTTLDLGGLSSSAEVWINGGCAGVLCAPPWRIAIDP